MALSSAVLVLVACILHSLCHCSLTQTDSGNLAVGRAIITNSTCGTEGPQEYCTLSLPGGNEDCFICDASHPANAHNADALSDRDSSVLSNRTWWQSENGIDSVTLELNLEALFYFTHLVLTFRSPRPGAAVVEVSRDFGATYGVHQYYSSNCEGDFGLPDRSSISSFGEVICTSEYSDLMPLSNGELIYQALPPSLGITDLNDPSVVERLTLTNLRIRFNRLNILPDDDITDPATRARYYYAVYNVVVRGWCFCNGHAQSCDPPPGTVDPEPGTVNPVCRCMGNTMGANCEQCQPLYNDRPWQPGNMAGDSSAFCEECECFGRASSCHYDPVVAMETGGSGGVCNNCTQNTAGRQCDECRPGFFRNTSASVTNPELCLYCDCDTSGTESRVCSHSDDPSDPNIVAGTCLCKENVLGEQCDRCKPGFFNFSAENPDGCQPCDCHPEGSTAVDSCDLDSGQCECVVGVSGRQCDMCPSGKVGPSQTASTICLDCFCNGYSTICDSDSGWYKARVNDLFETEEEKRSFRTDGELTPNTEGFLEAAARSSSLSISFPSRYLGDKRTSYGQRLLLNISLPNMAVGDGDCEASLEVMNRPKRYRALRLVFPLPRLQRDPQLVELPFIFGTARLDLSFLVRQAQEREIHEVLTDVVSMRLILRFPPGNSTTARTVRFFQTALDFATNSSQDEFAEQPLRSVSYVEDCSCPRNRLGSHCGNCSPGYTTDPSFGGEFARCVRCFCNFHSTSCDPETSVCFNCTDNTVGTMCERCQEGYYRPSSLTTDSCVECDCNPRGTVGRVCNTDNGQCDCIEGFAGVRCDRCADGYWDPGNGSCIMCDCHPDGTTAVVCNNSTGVCICREGVEGERCDMCQQNTTRIFPSCELCDECTGQWSRRIDQLQDDVTTTVTLISMLNFTNITVDRGELPALDILFDLLQQIQIVLNTSQIDFISSVVQSNHSQICTLINQTQLLIDRAILVQNRLNNLENTSENIRDELTVVIQVLVDLQSEFQNISQLMNFTMVDPTFHINLARDALERSDEADQLINTNVTMLISDTQAFVSNFTTKREESGFIDRQQNNTERLSILRQRLDVFENLIAEANQRLCGAGANGTCGGECGGVSCDVCGGEGCDSLVSDASEALNVSRRALAIVEDKLGRIRFQVDALEVIFSEAEIVRNDSIRAQGFATDTRDKAEELLRDLTELISEIESELNVTRVDPNEIGRLENMTLSLTLNVEEFSALLVAINATIDEFFTRAGVNESDLRRRAEEALRRAQAANQLAHEVVANATALEELLQQLQTQQSQGEATARQSETLITNAEEAIAETDPILDTTEETLNETRALLADLMARLEVVRQRIAENEQELERARNLTEEGQELASQIDEATQELEGQFGVLQNEVATKYRQSGEDLDLALDLRNRTNSLQRTTAEQLLQVESLQRIERDLVIEQEEIRTDIQRIANQLERLNADIQSRVARNTGCLDITTQSKRRRRRSRRHQLQ